MRDKAWVEQRIDEMAKCPPMWAVTQEGYLMQLAVLLEFIGANLNDIRTICGKLFHNDGNNGVKILDDNFAALAIIEIRKLMSTL